MRTGVRHLPLSKVMDGYKKIVTCAAASKTFNIAGLMLSNVIIPDRKLHAAFAARNINGLSVNPLSLAAAEAAYSRGGAWLKELRAYLDGNFRLLEETLHRELPKIPFTMPQATYLAWVDFSPYLTARKTCRIFSPATPAFSSKAGTASLSTMPQALHVLTWPCPVHFWQKG